jgi:hypothetical protein
MIARIFRLDFVVLMGESGPRLIATTTNAFKVQPSTRLGSVLKIRTLSAVIRKYSQRRDGWCQEILVVETTQHGVRAHGTILAQAMEANGRLNLFFIKSRQIAYAHDRDAAPFPVMVSKQSGDENFFAKRYFVFGRDCWRKESEIRHAEVIEVR